MAAPKQQKREPQPKLSPESAYELQKIDCNCNDCGFMFRLLDKQTNLEAKSKLLHEEVFYLTKNRKIAELKNSLEALIKAKDLIKDADKKIEKATNKITLKEADTFTWQPSTPTIQYGVCCKFQKQVTFIANTCQLDTQDCFVHRKDFNNKPSI